MADPQYEFKVVNDSRDDVSRYFVTSESIVPTLRAPQRIIADCGNGSPGKGQAEAIAAALNAAASA